MQLHVSGMGVFLRNVSFHGILLDSLFEGENPHWFTVRQLLDEGIRSGVVQPLSFTSFDKYEVEQAFRFMSSGKHIGKVLIEVGHSKSLCDCKIILGSEHVDPSLYV